MSILLDTFRSSFLCGKVKQGLVIPSPVSMSNVYFHLIAEPFISPALQDMPLVVIIDSEGNNLYDQGRAQYLAEQEK